MTRYRLFAFIMHHDLLPEPPDSGILEQYCLGMLPAAEAEQVERAMEQSPGIRSEVQLVQETLERMAMAGAIEPPARLREEIWSLLDNLNKEKAFDLTRLPLINRFSDHTNWLRTVQPLLPNSVSEDRIMHLLQQTETVCQLLVISKTDFEDEVHLEEHESFIILEGECECTVGDQVFRLQAGGFTQIPLYTHHDVRILSPYVVAILQRIAV